MIRMKGVCKAYATSQGPHQVLRGVDFTVAPGEVVGILGRNGAGKSTMIRILSGAEFPDTGTIERHMSVSWPLAFAGAFQGALTGLDNLRFICRVYGIDYRTRLHYVEDFAELGKFLREPVHTYSSGMRARLAFALSMAVDFDCFLVDEVVAVGDSRFRQRCQVELFEKRRDRAKILVSHDPNFLLQHSSRMVLLTGGQLLSFGNNADALDYYHAQQQEPAAAFD